MTPTASAALCDTSPRADATACFGIFHGSNGVDIDIYAFYDQRKCGFSGWTFSCRVSFIIIVMINFGQYNMQFNFIIRIIIIIQCQ